jgi:ABC-type antimicrobial peptide transport system permease subunit
VTIASVRQRYGEIGVRIALGATASDIRRLVLGEAFGLTAAGVSVGLALSLMTTRALRSLLFQTQPLDPATFLLAVVVLGGAALVASYVPAQQAVRINPADMLRNE